MQVSLRELLDKLGVGYEMGPYETCPWSVYSAEKGVTCNAEVRMNEDGHECEAEVMLIHDTPRADGSTLELFFRLYCKPSTAHAWSPFKMLVKGEDKTNFAYSWEDKGCTFFHACVQELKMDNIPDLEALLKRELTDESAGGTMRGGSSKAPKIKPQQLLGVKGAGRGF